MGILKRGDLVRIDRTTTRYPDDSSNPWDRYGLITSMYENVRQGNELCDLYNVRWFNGRNNGSYRYFGENSPHNDLIHIPHKERCPVVYTKNPDTGLVRVEIYSKYLMGEKVLTSSDSINEKNYKIKNELNEFFNTLKEKINHLGLIQYVYCYYKNNFDVEETKEKISRYTFFLGKNFILLDKIEIPHDQGTSRGGSFVPGKMVVIIGKKARHEFEIGDIVTLVSKEPSGLWKAYNKKRGNWWIDELDANVC